MNEGTMRATTLRLLGSAIGIALLLGLLGAGLAWGCPTYDEGTTPPTATVKASRNQLDWSTGTINVGRGDTVYFKGTTSGGGALPDHDWDTINGTNTDQGAGTFIAQWNFKDPDSWGSAVGINNVVSHVYNTRGNYNVLMRTDDSGTIFPDAPVDAGSIAVYVHDPVYEIAIIQPDGGTIGGITPIRVRVKTRDATLTHLLAKEHEDIDPNIHPWEWVIKYDDSPPTAMHHPEHLESSETDPNTGITTTLYRFDWDTTAVHNGNHIIYAEGNFTLLPSGTDTVSDTNSTEVKNLVVSASPEVLIWDGETEPELGIELEDAVSDTTTVVLNIYDSWQNLVRTETFYWLPGSHSYTWDGKNENGDLLDSGIYLYTLDAEQPEQGDDDSATRGRVLSAHADFPDEWSGPGLAPVTVDFSIGLPGFSARVDVYGPAGNPTQDWQGTPPIPANQTVYFPQFGYDLVGMGPGEVVFLVTAYANEATTDRAHRNRRMLQHNDRHKKGVHMLVLDPGHGIDYKPRGAPGAWDNDNRNEEGIALDIALEVESLFTTHFEKSTAATAEVILTRRTASAPDDAKTMEGRRDIAVKAYNDWLKKLTIKDTPSEPGIHQVMHDTHWKQVPFYGAVSIHCSPGGNEGLPFKYRYPEKNPNAQPPERNFKGEYGKPLAECAYSSFIFHPSIPYISLYRCIGVEHGDFYLCNRAFPAGILAEVGAIGRHGILIGAWHRDWEVWTDSNKLILADYLFHGIMDRIFQLPSHD